MKLNLESKEALPLNGTDEPNHTISLELQTQGNA
jgi:hypothetical protein